jgi:hypothetical protein
MGLEGVNCLSSLGQLKRASVKETSWVRRKSPHPISLIVPNGPVVYPCCPLEIDERIVPGGMVCSVGAFGPRLKVVEE